MLRWIAKHPRATPDMLGFLPGMLSDYDPRPAREQMETNYAHGGGWTPFRGFTMKENGIRYPGDPLCVLLFETRLREETIRVYDGGPWMAIIQPDGEYEICRID
jgi:hypothetical protein